MARNVKASVGAAFLMFSLWNQGHASGVVAGATEITQILNNIELAMQTATQYQEYYTQVEQWGLQKRQNFAGNDNTLLGDIGRVARMVQAARSAASAAEDLRSNLGSLHQVGQQRFQNFIASGMTWDAYVARETTLASQQRERAKVVSRTEEAAIDRVNETWTTLQSYQSEIRTTTGEHQALRVMNGQMNSLLGTLNSLAQVTASRSSAETEKDWVDGMRKEEAQRKSDLLRQQAIQNQERNSSQLERLKNWRPSNRQVDQY